MDFQTLLRLFNESGGVGVRLDGHPYPIRAGEKVVPYINRVLEEHNERKAGEEATLPSPSEDNEIRDGQSGSSGSAASSARDAGDVQGREESLEEFIKAKVSSLRRSREARSREITAKNAELRALNDSYRDIERELSHAERFLSELSSEVCTETSGDIPSKEE